MNSILLKFWCFLKQDRNAIVTYNIQLKWNTLLMHNNYLQQRNWTFCCLRFLHKLIDWPWWTLFLPVCLSVLLTSYVPLWHDLWCKHYLAASRPGGGSNAPAGSNSCPCSQGHSPHTRPVRQGQITPHTDPHHTEFFPPECRVSAEGIAGAWKSDVCDKKYRKQI